MPCGHVMLKGHTVVDDGIQPRVSMASTTNVSPMSPIRTAAHSSPPPSNKWILADPFVCHRQQPPVIGLVPSQVCPYPIFVTEPDITPRSWNRRSRTISHLHADESISCVYSHTKDCCRSTPEFGGLCAASEDIRTIKG